MNNCKYEETAHPMTGDLMWRCKSVPESISLVEKFIRENFREGNTLSICDTTTGNTIEIENPIEEIINAVTKIIGSISSAEHTFVDFVGINSLTDSYVVGMEFTRGNFVVPSIYKYEDGKLVFVKKNTFEGI